MSINLTTKYAGAIEKAFTHDSYIKGMCRAKVDLLGAKSCRVYQLKTVPVVDYARGGTGSRFGDGKDVDDTVLEYTMTQDKAFKGIVDKGDQTEQSISDKAGQWLRQQLREQVVPTADMYALARFARLGHVAGVAAAPAKSTIVTMLFDAATYMDENLVPDEGRVVFMPAKYYPMVILSDEWAGLDKLAGTQLPTGACGQIAGFTVIKMPSRLFAENQFFTAMHKSAAAFPYKINETKIHEDTTDVSGAVITGRQTYDVFVIGSKADAVYTAVLSTKKQAAPTIAAADDAATVTSAGAAEIRVTLDGSDPRFAMPYNADTRSGYIVYASPVKVKSGDLVRAVAFGAAGKFTSEIAEKKI